MEKINLELNQFETNQPEIERNLFEFLNNSNNLPGNKLIQDENMQNGNVNIHFNLKKKN